MVRSKKAEVAERLDKLESDIDSISRNVSLLTIALSSNIITDNKSSKSTKSTKKTKSDKESSRKGKPSWINKLERVGPYTTKLLAKLSEECEQELNDSNITVKIIDDNIFMTEVDRERAVKLYCEMYDNVDRERKQFIFDNFLLDLISNDAKLMKELDNGYILDLKNAGTYRSKLASALRRLDHSYFHINNINNIDA